MSTGRENISLNALRAAAAILVVVSHVRNLFLQDYSSVSHTRVNQVIYAVGSLGRPAVILFFTLSGYWVGGSVIRAHKRGDFSWTGYAVNRLSRLWLVLIPALILTAIADVVGLHAYAETSVFRGAHGYFSVPADLRAHLTFVVGIANVAFLQTIHAKTFGNNGPLWSLAYEFWFYALFPCLLTACWPGQQRPRRLAFGLIAIAIGLFVGGVVMEFFVLWLLGAGVAWGRAEINTQIDQRPASVEVTARVTLIVLVVATMLLDKERPGFGSDLLLGTASAALVAVLTLDRGWGLADGIVSRFSAYAHSSYSLYAIHFPLVALAAAIVVPHIDHRWQPTGGHLLEALAVVAAAVSIAWIFARLTERNTQRVRSWVRGTHRPATP